MIEAPLPTGEDKTRAVRTMFDAIAGRYEMVNKLMTLGLDARWRRRAVRDLRLPARSVVLDVAAGTGDFTRELTRQNQCPVATDLSFGMLHAGRHLERRVQADASAMPFASGVFDGVADFDKATQSPQDPLMFNPQYDSGDHLHPNDAGYYAMAQSIDLSSFK